MSKAKMADIAPNNQHWIDWRKSKNLPINSPSNCIKISADNLARLKKELSKQEK